MPAPASADPFKVRKLYRYLRVVDVCDALDGIGYFNIGLMSPELRPLWPGMKFWGVALTQRCVPSNRPMWKLDTTQEIVDTHRIWYAEVGHVSISELIEPGCVIVTDTGDTGEVGFWGSKNSLGCIAAGAVGIVTDGYCRDTYEVALQKTPIVCRRRGRTIIPGRIMCVEAQTTVSCGGAQVRPGDMVGCDDDGVVAVPQEVAEEVAHHAIAVLLDDMRARRQLYERLKMPADETVDVEKVEAYYRGLNAL
jgi:4-hydroxy-4-methyl-2-oxoglutarate aldolase